MDDNQKEVVNKILKSGKKIYKIFLIKFIIGMILLATVLIFLASIYHFLTIDSGTENPSNPSNVPGNVSVFLDNITIGKDGMINFEDQETGEELWKRLVEAESNVNGYLKNSEELMKLVNAQIVTQFLDTRSDPDEEIDWDDNQETIIEHGIIKLKREDTSGEISNMTFIDSESFYSKVSDYNSNPTDEKKNEILGLYTIDGSIVKDIEESEDGETTPTVVEGTGDLTFSGDDLCWPADKTGISSYFGMRTLGGTTREHKGIDIPLTDGVDAVYACEDGIVTKANYDPVDFGNQVYITHGNGYQSRYFHNSSLTVSVGDEVTKGQQIAVAGTTGDSTGPHVHFEIRENITSANGNVYNDGTAVNPLLFRYTNNMGEGAAGTSSNNYAVIAKITESSSETTDYVNDAQVDTWSESTYVMTTDKINYQELVSKYTMPFNYLWAMTLITEHKDFVFELADLVYDSKIEITVYDNVTTKDEEITQEYSEMAHVNADVAVTVVRSETVDDVVTNVPYTNSKVYDEIVETKYKTVTKTNTVTDTPNIKVTLVDCWFMEYKDEYEKSNTTTELGPYETTQDDEVGELVSLLQLEDKYGYIEALYNSAGGTGTIISKSVTKYDATEQVTIANQKQTTNIVTNTNRYDSTGTVARGKDEYKPESPNEDEVNFVTLILKSSNSKAKGNILDTSDWLFEILEANSNTADMVDLTKYLLYKAFGIDYGVTSLDFNLYKPSSFTSVAGSIETKVWFALIQAGYSEYAAAGVMGNIEAESGFDPAIVEAGNGIGYGLCQWSFTRRDELEAYASAMGVEPSDVDLQIQFLLYECAPKGEQGGYASYAFVSLDHLRENWVNATNVADATAAFMNGFERPNAAYAHLDRRIASSNYYYDMYSGMSASSLSIPAGASVSEKLNILFPSGIPSSSAAMSAYMTTISVPMTTKAGVQYDGKITVHKDVAQDVYDVFLSARNAGFKIYDAGGYNYRTVSGTSTLSQHSYGIAIDINVAENPYIVNGSVSVGSAWQPGVNEFSIESGGVLVNAFKMKGWGWRR